MLALWKGMSEGAEQHESKVKHLEERVMFLTARFMSETDDASRHSIQRELNAVEMALEHHRSTLKDQRAEQK